MEFCHERSTLQDFPHNFTLNTNATSMNDANQRKSLDVSLLEVRFDGLFHIARGERMQIERVLYRKLNHIGLIRVRIEHKGAELPSLERRPAAMRSRWLLLGTALGKRRGGRHVAKIQFTR